MRPNLKRDDSVPGVTSSPKKALRKESRHRFRVVSQKTGTPGGTVRGRNSDRPDGHLRKAVSKQAVTSYKAEQYAEFRRGMQAHDPLTALCTRLKIGKNTASNWIQEMHLDDLTVLRACRVNAMLVAETLHKLLEAKIPKWNPAKKRWDLFDDGWVQLKTVHEICLLLDLYPRPRQKEPDGPGVVLGHAVEVPSSTTNTNLQNENRGRKETEPNESRNASDALESAGKPWDERLNENGRPSDAVSQQPSSMTANVASQSEESRKTVKMGKGSIGRLLKHANPQPNGRRMSNRPKLDRAL